MSEFLEFLNTAPHEKLVKVNGLDDSLAERLIAARPLPSVEESLKVEGMSEELLENLKSTFNNLDQSKPVKSAPEEVQAVVEEKPVHTHQPARVWVKILRAVLIILILAGTVYAAVIYGVPYIYNTFLRPVENNTAQLSEVAAQQAADAKRLDGEIAALQERVATLEGRADGVDKAIAAQGESLANLDSLQTQLEQKLADQGTQLSSEMNYQINLIRAVDYLSRARLYLSQSNFGLARADALSARTLLGVLLPSAPPAQTYALNEAISRLDLALANLPAYPVVAVYDIDIAWQYLADGLNAVSPTVIAPAAAPTESTPISEATPETTSTP